MNSIKIIHESTKTSIITPDRETRFINTVTSILQEDTRGYFSYLFICYCSRLCVVKGHREKRSRTWFLSYTEKEYPLEANCRGPLFANFWEIHHPFPFINTPPTFKDFNQNATPLLINTHPWLRIWKVTNKILNTGT